MIESSLTRGEAGVAASAGVGAGDAADATGVDGVAGAGSIAAGMAEALSTTGGGAAVGAGATAAGAMLAADSRGAGTTLVEAEDGTSDENPGCGGVLPTLARFLVANGAILGSAGLGTAVATVTAGAIRACAKGCAVIVGCTGAGAGTRVTVAIWDAGGALIVVWADDGVGVTVATCATGAACVGSD